jgi:hypothetical protein
MWNIVLARATRGPVGSVGSSPAFATPKTAVPRPFVTAFEPGRQHRWAWKWSSFHDHVRQGWVEEDWGTTEPEEIGSLEAGE